MIVTDSVRVASMVQQTRQQFLKTIGVAAASVLSHPARWCLAQAPAAIPSYLRGFEHLYRDDRRAAAVAWHRNAKWGLFLHYSLHSLRGLKARDVLQAKDDS